MKIKAVFAGTPAFALPSLRALHARGAVCAVLTQPDKPQGRKGILTPSPVKAEAEKLGIPVLQPARLREDYGALKEIGADVMVTCAYGQLLTQEVLNLFPQGVWNVHASLLPAYRGAAPIARALMDGQTQTGVTIMKTELGLDTGDILLAAPLSISQEDTAGTLTDRLSGLGAELVCKALDLLESGDFTLEKQGDGFVCKKVARTQVDFSRSASEVSALIRGLSPSPLAFGKAGETLLNFYFAEEISYDGKEPCGTAIGVNPKEGLVVKCGNGAVKITRLQPAGGKVMSARDYLNGRKIAEGTRFEQPVL